MRKDKCTVKVRSVRFNFIMNFILTASSVLFPLITFPYISRVLQAAGNGKVAFATSVLTYFSMFASLGIPTYGIRACARVRDDRKKLSKIVQELMILNIGTMAVTYAVFIITLFVVPKFTMQKELLLINSISLVLNVFGVNWLYNAIEQYAYITICSIVFKVISIGMMFAWVKDQSDYIVYTGICVFAASGSYIMNLIRLRKFVDFKKSGIYNFHQHMKPIMVFFAMSAATSVYTNLDVVMLGFMKTDADVGYYNASIKIKSILVLLITSLGTVLLPRLSYYVEQKNEKAFQVTITKALRFVIFLSLPVMVYFMLLARESILFLSGKGFEGAILPMIFLMPTVLFIGLSNVTGIQVLTPRSREKEVLISIICGAVVDFALNVVMIPRFGAAGAAFATMVAELVVLIVQVIFLKDSTLLSWREIKIHKFLLGILIGVILTAAVQCFLHISAFGMLCVTAVVFFGGYLLALILLKEEQTKEIMQICRTFIKR